MTRTEYLNSKDSFREYYGQFVTPTLIHRVMTWIHKDHVIASQDPHFNDIPLKLWDRIPIEGLGITNALKAQGDYLTKAGWVCIAKEAARMWKEAQV